MSAADKLAAVEAEGSTGSWHTRTLYLAITRDPSTRLSRHTWDRGIRTCIAYTRVPSVRARAIRRFPHRRPTKVRLDVTTASSPCCTCAFVRDRANYRDARTLLDSCVPLACVNNARTATIAQMIGGSVAGSLRLRKCTILPSLPTFLTRFLSFLLSSFPPPTSPSLLYVRLCAYGCISCGLISPSLDNKRFRTATIRVSKKGSTRHAR